MDGCDAVGWVIEPKQLAPTVTTARTALTDTNGKAVIMVTNFGDKPVVLAEGVHLGEAEKVMSCQPCSPIAAAAAAADTADRMEELTEQVKDTLPSHLQPLLTTAQPNLTLNELEKVRDFLVEFQDTFSKDQYDIGRTDLIPHTIDTGNSRPVKQPLRRHPLAHLEFIDAEVEKLLELGIVEPSSAPWASNIVWLPKRMDGCDHALIIA
jgi:hypothetical protein